MKFTKIDIRTYQGGIPQGHELVIMEENGNIKDSLVLLGFDEVFLFANEFSKPIYGFVK